MFPLLTQIKLLSPSALTHTPIPTVLPLGLIKVSHTHPRSALGSFTNKHGFISPQPREKILLKANACAEHPPRTRSYPLCPPTQWLNSPLQTAGARPNTVIPLYSPEPLTHRIATWHIHVTCPWVLSTIEHGYKIQFARKPPSFQGLTPSVVNTNSVRILREEIEALLQQNAVKIIPPHVARSGFYSRYFVVPKKDGGSRPILDLRALNRHIRTYSFKMLTHKQLITSIKPGDWFTKLDLKQAYFHVSIHKHHRQFLRFYFEGRALEFQVLPFGLATAPRLFTKIMDAAISPLRERGMRIFGYIDDYLLCAPSAQIATEHTHLFRSHLESLGFRINYQKSVLTPAQTVHFLGLTLDSTTFRAKLTPQRVESFHKCLSNFQLGKKVKFRICLRLLGLMASMIAVVPLGQLYMRDMQRWVFSLRLHPERRAHLNRQITVSLPCIRALLTWRDPALLSQGAPLGLIVTRRVVTTDASLSGWGATLGDLAVGGVWTENQCQLHINVLELTTVFLALKHFLPLLRHHHVLVRTDNTAVVAYINHQGGLRSLRLHRIARDIILWAHAHLQSLRATHVPGVLNVRADRLSRACLSNQEWRLHPRVIELVWKRFGRAEVDLFASRENTHCRLFFSIRDRDAPLGTDALSHPWPNTLLYAFPPVHLIPHVLARVREESLSLVLIAPWWTNKPWLAEIFLLLAGQPWRLPNSKDLLSQMGGELVHPNPSAWNLHAFHVKGTH